MPLCLNELQNLCKTNIINLNTAVAVVFVAGLATACFINTKGPFPLWIRAFFVHARRPKLGVGCCHSVATGSLVELEYLHSERIGKP